LVPSQANEKLIYISRRGSKRSPVNELEVERNLEGLGFKIVNPEGMPFVSQVDLFRSAKVIVGVHGAGMANQIWSTSLRGIVEIQTPSHFNDCFARLAVSRDVEYSSSMCKSLVGGGEVVMIDEVVNAVKDQLLRH
jgi:capsular polysaccharide biosynthesis protein